jgi:hypothetical protein
MSLHRKPPHGGAGRTARWRRQRAAKWAKRLALGDAAAAQHLAHRRLGLRSVSLRRDLQGHMRMMRQARAIKREERDKMRRLRSLGKCPALLPILGARCPRCSFAYGLTTDRGHELSICARNYCLCGGTRLGHREAASIRDTQR